MAHLLPPSNATIIRKLEQHTTEDERRFDGVESKLANISGKLYVILGVIAASGLANFFGHSG